MHLPRKLQRFVDSKDEHPLWWGEPNSEPMLNRALEPIKYLVGFVGAGLLIWAVGVFFSEINARSGGAVDSRIIDNSLGYAFHKTFYLLIAASVFFVFLYILRRHFKPDARNTKYYMLTDQRAQIIEFNELRPEKSIRQFVGRGEMHKPSLEPGANGLFNLIFFQTPKDFGSIAVPDGDSVPRKPIAWNGFYSLSKPVAEDVSELVSDLIAKTIPVVNKHYHFSFDVPKGWTLHTVNMRPERRDDLMLNIVMGDMLETHNLLRMPQVLNEWNGAILTKRLPPFIKTETGFVPGLTIVIEATRRSGVPTGVERWVADDFIGINREINNRLYVQRALMYHLYICEFRRGYRISQKLIDELLGWDNNRGERVIPDDVLEKLDQFKDWETADKKFFQKFLNQWVLPTGLLKRFNPGWKDRIIHLAAVNFPYTTESKGKAAKLLLNPRAMEIDDELKTRLFNGFDTVYKLESEMKIVMKNYNMLQYYGYRTDDSKESALHLRFTFFCLQLEAIDNMRGRKQYFEVNLPAFEKLLASIRLG